ncbi:MAG: hypothetical protein Q7S87_03130 [Agitococcus sp.]|nr:hypothetical protein [Agitococcus sp.]MDO9178631.1 hypothetical protein [Agitococcus sp.]
MNNANVVYIENHPWDLAKRQVLTRNSSVAGDTRCEALDPGVNFFVLALEALGATTRFSCEGHPYGFYVAFDADYDLAREISRAGFFTIEISGNGIDEWVMRKSGTEANPLKRANGYTEADKARTLRWAAEAWVSCFGQRLGTSGLTPRNRAA